MKIRSVINVIESYAPLQLQESYDNSGLQAGDPNAEASRALICLDITEAVVREAIEKKCQLIISHHPLIFEGLKQISPSSATGRIIAEAIRHNITIYTAHTNLDNAPGGVSKAMADRLGLINQKILSPKKDYLHKLVTFCPVSHADSIRTALFKAGAGHIGNYDCCSYNTEGTGTFKGLENTKPFVGKKGSIHHEKEIRIETIFPAHLEKTIISALLAAHPYEEAAFDLYPLKNSFPAAGSGMTGDLKKALTETQFIRLIKQTFKTGCIRHSSFTGKPIKKIALCGGSGGFLVGEAMKAGADAYLSGDIKYHDFFKPEGKMLLADIGHYESEQYTKQLLYSILNKKLPTFALLLSEQDRNPVNYQ